LVVSVMILRSVALIFVVVEAKKSIIIRKRYYGAGLKK